MTNKTSLPDEKDALATVLLLANDSSNEATDGLEKALLHADKDVVRAAASALLARGLDKSDLTRIAENLEVSDLCSRCGKVTIPRSAYEGQVGAIMMGDVLEAMLDAKTAARYICRRCKEVHCIVCSSAYPCRTPFCRHNVFDSV
jgi:hypothetical protein